MVKRLTAAALAALLLPAPASAETTTARALLGRLTIAAEAGSSTYDRSRFTHWTDADGDCRNTRHEVLAAESRVTATWSSSGCTVVRGRWYSWYDGATWTYPGDLDVDHMVPLKEAWESGARGWTSTTRRRYANDLGHSFSLEAVTDNVNQAKGDRDPAAWLPPHEGAHCRYAIRWVVVKYRWRLTVDNAERARLASLLGGDCGNRTVTVPRRAF